MPRSAAQQCGMNARAPAASTRRLSCAAIMEKQARQRKRGGGDHASLSRIPTPILPNPLATAPTLPSWGILGPGQAQSTVRRGAAAARCRRILRRSFLLGSFPRHSPLSPLISPANPALGPISALLRATVEAAGRQPLPISADQPYIPSKPRAPRELSHLDTKTHREGVALLSLRHF